MIDRRVTLVPAVVGASVMAASTASADVNSVIKNASENIGEYVVYRQNDAQFSFGQEVGKNFSGTGIFVTVVKEDDLGGSNPESAAKAILDSTTSHDSIIMVVKQNNGTDKVVTASRLDNFSASVANITGGEAKDMGEVLYNSSGRILSQYERHGGDVSGESVAVMNQYNSNVNSTINNAIEAQGETVVYQSKTSDLISHADKIASTFQGSDVRVSVFKQNSVPDETASSLANKIASGSSHAASVVVVQGDGKETIAASSKEKDLATKLKSVVKDDTQVDSGKSGEWLNEHSQQITGAVSQWNTEVAAAKEKEEQEWKEMIEHGFNVVGLLVGFVLFVSLAGAGIKAAVRHAEKAEKERKAQEKKAEEERIEAEKKAEQERAEMARLEGKTKRVDELLKELSRSLSKTYKASKPTGKALDELIRNTNRMYTAIQEQEQTHLLQEVNFVTQGRLEKILNIIGKKYLQDIAKNPGAWKDPKGKIEAVTSTLKNVSDSINREIISINEAGSFEVNVDMAILNEGGKDDVSSLLEELNNDLDVDTMMSGKGALEQKGL